MIATGELITYKKNTAHHWLVFECELYLFEISTLSSSWPRELAYIIDNSSILKFLAASASEKYEVAAQLRCLNFHYYYYTKSIT